MNNMDGSLVICQGITNCLTLEKGFNELNSPLTVISKSNSVAELQIHFITIVHQFRTQIQAKC